MFGRSRAWVTVVVVLVVAPAVAAADDRAALERAQKLAWEKHFGEAERIYRAVLQHSPDSSDAARGLAQVILWQGHYREARRRFLQLGDLEGAATAAYWQGDFRTAAREFREIVRAHPERSLARESLSAIEAASRGTDRLENELLHDDQPYRSLWSAARSSFFSDPLTRWDVTAGAYTVRAPRNDARRELPFVALANEAVLPWQRLTITTSAGARRFGDGSARPMGAATIRLRTSAASSVAATLEHRELMTNASGLRTHPSVTRAVIGWTRYAERGWLGGFEMGSMRYFDHNSGRYSQGYALFPLRGSIFVGGSAALRDTSDSRFYLDAVSATRTTAGDFAYAYRGSYTPYWTPKHWREARAIALLTRTIPGGMEIKAQLEGGIAHDRVVGFGPPHGSTSLPASIYSFDFARTSRPIRASAGLTVPLGARYRIECAVERTTNAFYVANSIHATVVRYR